MGQQYSITVEPDDFTKAASVAFDYKFDGTSTFTGWTKPSVPDNFGIGLIVGPSGSGKSLLLKEFGQEKHPTWDNTKAVVSQFSTPSEAIDKLTAVGLNSIPAWCKPYSVLSTGEKFRADLARKLENGAIIDEYTSVVDRNVAKAASVALRRYVNTSGLKGIVIASCHHDIIEWLEPDWIFDTSVGEVTMGKFFRPKINLNIYKATTDLWPTFAPHHYLNGGLNRTARCYLATWKTGDEEIMVGFVATLAMPSGSLKNAWRESRLVILPDFQGMGIGPRLSDAIGQMYIEEGKRYFSRTAHPRMGHYRDNSGLWRKTSKYRLQRFDQTRRKEMKGSWHRWEMDDVRVCYSHEYVGRKI